MAEAAPIAVWGGRVVALDQVGIPVWDDGFIHGAHVVEQLRTYAGKVPLLDFHLRRLERGLRALEIDNVDPNGLRRDVHTVISQNGRSLPSHADLGISIVISPGHSPLLAPAENVRNHSQTLVYSFPLPLAEWSESAQTGVRLTTATWREIPAACCPKDFKHRSRLNYFLARHEVARRAPGTRPLILTLDGRVAGGATGGVLIKGSDSAWSTPPSGAGLASVTIEVLSELVSGSPCAITRRELGMEELKSACEVVWCSSPSGPLPVTEVDGRPIGNGTAGPAFRDLERLWSSRVGIDYRGQMIAARRAGTTMA